MKTRKMVELLMQCNPNAVVKMHHRDGENVSGLVAIACFPYEPIDWETELV